MKKLFFLVLVIVTSFAQAAEVEVMNANIPRLSFERSFVDTRFYMNTKTGEGFVQAKVSQELMIRSNCPNPNWQACWPTSGRDIVTVYADTAKIEGLMLMGDQAVYQGAEGNVVCGTMGVSRVFKVPTLYLNGNCKLNGKIVRTNTETKLVVTLTTK